MLRLMQRKKDRQMKGKRWISRLVSALMICVMAVGLTACVDQKQGKKDSSSDTKKESQATDQRIVACSMAIAEIADKMNLDLVGVPTETLTPLPDRYKGVTDVGSPMSPDMEIIKSLNPDVVLCPLTLKPSLETKFKDAGITCYFLNLKSVPGMYKSIQQLGEKFGREKEADKLVDEFKTTYKKYADRNKDKESPTVLILMGVPGAYIVATEESYVGSLAKLAGATNVYEGETEEFIEANTEDMQKKDPDIILRCAHAMPDQVKEMFAKDFATNDIWKHFRAVQEGKVYDLSYDHFGMSAKFNWPEALDELQPYLYGDDNEK